MDVIHANGLAKIHEWVRMDLNSPTNPLLTPILALKSQALYKQALISLL